MPRVTWTSALSDIAEPHYRSILDSVALASGIELEFIDGPWPERLDRLIAGEVDAGFFCAGLMTGRGQGLLPLVSPVYAEMDSATYGSYVITRDPARRGWREFRGARLAYNEPESLSGYQGILAELRLAGEGADFFGALVPCGSHSAAMQAVQNGEADLATIDLYVWELSLAATPSLGSLHIGELIGPWPGQPFAIHEHVPDETRERLRETFLGLSAQSLAAARIERFAAMSHEDYQPLRELLGGSVEA